MIPCIVKKLNDKLEGKHTLATRLNKALMRSHNRLECIKVSEIKFGDFDDISFGRRGRVADSLGRIHDFTIVMLHPAAGAPPTPISAILRIY